MNNHLLFVVFILTAAIAARFECSIVVYDHHSDDFASSSSSFGSKIYNFLDDYNLLKKEVDLTCFTCQRSKSNDECNRKAIDEPCDSRRPACLTVHRFNSLTMKTISVEKKCALDCSAKMVGCSVLRSTTTSATSKFNPIMECSYCCNQNYCNMEVALNSSQAFNLTQNSLRAISDSSHLNYHVLTIVLAAAITSMLLF